MKKIAKRVDVSLPPVRIEISDLAEGLAPIVPKDGSITVTWAGYEFDSFAEFAKEAGVDSVSKTQVQIDMGEGASDITIDFESDSVSIVSYSPPNPNTSHVITLLRENVKWFSLCPTKSRTTWALAGFLLVFGMWAMVLLVLMLYGVLPSSSAPVVAPLASMLTVASLPMHRFFQFGRTRIWLVPRASRKNWFVRHKDDLIKGVLVAAVAYLMGKFL